MASAVSSAWRLMISSWSAARFGSLSSLYSATNSAAASSFSIASIKAERQPVHVLAGEGIDEAGPHVGQQGEVQFTGLGLVVVHVLHEPVMFGGRRAQDFRHGGAGENDLAGQLRQQVQPRGLLGKKAQLHSYRSPEIVRTGKGGPRDLTWGPATSQYFTGPRVRA